MSIIESLEWRYAVKKFDVNKNLSEEQIATIKNAFNLTATSYGLQPVKLIIIKDRLIKEALVPHSWQQQQVADASHLLIFAIEKGIDSDYITSYFNRVKKVRNTPDVVLDPFKESLIDSFKEKNREEVNEWATKQAYLAMGNLLTVCAIEKIDACPMEGFIPEEYDRILSLEEKGLSAVLVMPVGYRADDDMFSDFKKVRKELHDSIITIQ
ncbi:NAD(P)H-dependent oxidoreductase [Spongiivirga citrea]|uniref:NAD(P)H-dependent oxidoreductase n=1 Tax=Spongiivirga citrea TaxID=1481457 RepID=A0A6M0CG04_9FLAO|nr:NAD(P)H-dependent oxidoreductase [Spongiivirga citrea]NER16765.1 NAD(P)H-dependent oxidoreductase [Spongiivirga citrea]